MSSNFVMVHVNIDKKTFEDLNNLMNTRINDKKTNIMLYSVHTGSKQAFYRRLIDIGINKINEDLKKKIKEFEQDGN